MVRASELMSAAGMSANVMQEFTGSVSANAEVVTLFEKSDLLDGGGAVLEGYLWGDGAHQDYFKVMVRRHDLQLYFSLLEGVLRTRGINNTGVEIIAGSGTGAGEVILPGVDFNSVVLDSPGSGSWVVPHGVTSVNVACIGGGGGGDTTSSDRIGGAGGGLAWKNNIAVTPGQEIAYTVGAGGGWELDGGDTTILGVTAHGGGASVGGVPGAGGGYSGADGGGFGGDGADYSTRPGGGGGAGGYTGNGGKGVKGNASFGTVNQGTGGGAAGGRGGASSQDSWRGGGTNLYGEGASGASLISNYGENGSYSHLDGFNKGYGAGGPGNNNPKGYVDPERDGGIRIMWGYGRTFPSNAAAVIVPPSLLINGVNGTNGNKLNTFLLKIREL